MRVLDIIFKDAYAILEISITDLEKLKRALDLSKIDYDSSNKEEQDAIDYLTKRLYPDIVKTIKRVKGEEE